MGNIKVIAKIRVTTKYLKGLFPDTYIASICSVTRMEPNSAPIPEAIRPAQIRAVITGPISLTIDIPTIFGIHETAPNSIRVGRDCKVSTKPKIKPVNPTKNQESTPN